MLAGGVMSLARDYDRLERSSRSTSIQMTTMANRLIAILSSIPRKGLMVRSLTELLLREHEWRMREGLV